MRKVTLNVTQAFIDRGMRKICGECPIALAAQEATGNPDIEFNGDVFFMDDFGSEWIKAPEIARDFANDFDTGNPVHLISFDVEFPESWFEKPESAA